MTLTFNFKCQGHSENALDQDILKIIDFWVLIMIGLHINIINYEEQKFVGQISALGIVWL